MSKIYLIVVFVNIFLLHLCSAGCGIYTASDGSKYDLDPLTRFNDYSFAESAEGTETYWYNYCENINVATDGINCSSPAPAVQIGSAGVCTILGYLPPTLSDHPSGPKYGVKIMYINNVDLCGNPKNVPRIAVFILSCNYSTPYNLVNIQEPGLCEYEFNVDSIYACPGYTPTSSSYSSSSSSSSPPRTTAINTYTLATRASSYSSSSSSSTYDAAAITVSSSASPSSSYSFASVSSSFPDTSTTTTASGNKLSLIFPFVSVSIFLLFLL